MTSRRAFLAGAGALAVSPLLPAAPVGAGEMITATAAKEAGIAMFGGDAYWLSTTGEFWVYRKATESLSKLAFLEGK